MATYDYKCTECGYEFEMSCRISEHSNVAVCPSCDGRSKQIIKQACSFDSYFDGSYKKEYEGL